MKTFAQLVDSCPALREIRDNRDAYLRATKPKERTPVQKELDAQVIELFGCDFKPVMIEFLKIKGIRRIGE